MPSYDVVCDNGHHDNVFVHHMVEGDEGLPRCRGCGGYMKKSWSRGRAAEAGEGDWGYGAKCVDPITGEDVTIRNEADRRAMEEKYRKTSGKADGVLLVESPKAAKVRREEILHRRFEEGRKIGLPDPVMTRRDFWG